MSGLSCGLRQKIDVWYGTLFLVRLGTRTRAVPSRTRNDMMQRSYSAQFLMILGVKSNFILFYYFANELYYNSLWSTQSETKF